MTVRGAGGRDAGDREDKGWRECEERQEGLLKRSRRKCGVLLITDVL